MKTDLVSRTVKNKVHTYFVTEPGIKPDGTWGDVTVERQARRGESIDIPEAQANLGDKHGAFYSDAELKRLAEAGASPADDLPPGPPVGDQIDLVAMDDAATVAWLKGEREGTPKPSIPQVLSTVNAAPEAEREAVAQRVLDAEKARGDSDPRSTLVGPLEQFLAEEE